jgi:CRP-like cAMP-binding protein
MGMGSSDVAFVDVSRMTLFRGFDEEFVRLLDLFFVANLYEAGTVIVEQGKFQNTFFLVVAGEAEAVHCLDGEKEVHLGHLSGGQFFGEMNLFDPGIATATVRALTPVKTLEISNDKFRYFINAKPDVAADFTFQLAETIVKRFRASKDSLVEELTNPENIRKAQLMDNNRIVA